MTELLIKNLISEILFGNKVCESLNDKNEVNYLYDELMLEKLLYGQHITVPELRSLLRKKILNFKFIKLNGEIRPAKGTTMMKYIPHESHPKGIRPSSPKVATFYDLQKNDWRSVSQRSKQIVLGKDEETGKPIVMVKDKGVDKNIAVDNDNIPDNNLQPDDTITSVDQIDISTNQPEISSDIDLDLTPSPEVEPISSDDEADVKSIKPVLSTDVKKMFYFVNPKTGASKTIEMTPKAAVDELKRMGSEWQLSDKNEFDKHEKAISRSTGSYQTDPNEEGEPLAVGDVRNYLNRFGENTIIKIVGEDPDGGFYGKTFNGGMFKIPAGRMQNIGDRVEKFEAPPKKITPVLNNVADLDDVDANKIF